MLIEFVGFSSSGKTRLITDICKIIGQNQNGCNIAELAVLNKKYTPNWETKWLSFMVDMRTVFHLPFLLLNRIKIIIKVLLIVIRMNVSLIRRLNYFRNFIKKLSIINLYRNNETQYLEKYCFFDEGTVQSLINILIHMNSDENELEVYTGKVDLPDVIIFIKTNSQLIVDKLQVRSERSQWSGLNDKKLEEYINRFNHYMSIVKKECKNIEEVSVCEYNVNLKNQGDIIFTEMISGKILKGFRN